MIWTITINGGAAKELWELGLEQPRRQIESQGDDVLTLNQAVEDLTADPLMGEDDQVVIRRGAEIYFTGWCIGVPRRADSGEYLGYEIAGPWRWLNRVPYQMAWPVQGGTAYASELLLNLTAPAQLISTREQILTALNYCLAQCAVAGIVPFTVAGANILPGFDLYPIVDQVRDVSCGEVVSRQLRWHPDAVVWFDYSSAVPALHIGRASALDAASLALTELEDGWSIAPKWGLQVSCVALKYRRTSTVNGATRMQFVTDIWPADKTGAEVDALVRTMQIEGDQIQFATATIETAPILAQDASESGRLAWWLERRPAWKKLYDEGRIPRESITLELDSVTTDRADAGNVNELVNGTIAPWMNFNAEKCKFHAEISCDEYDENGVFLRHHVKKKLSTTVRATDAISGTYRSDASVTSGDPIPPTGAGGLANLVYDNLRPVYWTGQASLVEEDCSGLVGVGKVVNLTGGRSDWAAMRGIIQSVTEDWENGTTQFRFGPPGHLGLDDYLALLSVLRRRVRTIGISALGTDGMSSQNLELGEDVPEGAGDAGDGARSKDTVYDADGKGKITTDAVNVTHEVQRTEIIYVHTKAPATGGIVKLVGPNGSITLDTALCAGKDITVREFPYCIAGDDSWRVLLAGSAPYKP